MTIEPSLGGMEHSNPGRRARAGDFHERLLKQVCGYRLTVGGGRAHVGERAKVLVDRLARTAPRLGQVEASARKRALSFLSALWRRRHAAACKARTDDAPSLKVDTYGEHNGRDILVEAFGHLESAVVLTR